MLYKNALLFVSGISFKVDAFPQERSAAKYLLRPDAAELIPSTSTKCCGNLERPYLKQTSKN